MSKCQFCKKIFTQKSNRFRHQKHCFSNPKRSIISCDRCQKQFSYPSSLKTHLKKSCPFHDKVKLSIRKKGEPPPYKPNIKILDDTILERLSLYLGKIEGIDFLLNNIYKKQYKTIIKEAYLRDLKTVNYPMTKDNYGRFRYLDHRSNLINDIDGSSLARLLTNYIQNAMLKACNQLISKYTLLGDMDPLYDKYKIQNLQKIAFELNSNTTEMTKLLDSSILLSPTHMFWRVN
jgi:hypothetical protein